MLIWRYCQSLFGGIGQSQEVKETKLNDPSGTDGIWSAPALRLPNNINLL